MYPWYDSKNTGKKFDLTYDDKIGIQTLYGKFVCGNELASKLEPLFKKPRSDFVGKLYHYVRNFHKFQ